MMQVAVEQGAFLTLLARLIGARRAVEVGTFTGYSAICIARGLADGGRLLCCDVSEEWTAIARRYWDRAGLADRIELRLGPALDTLRAPAARPQRSTSPSSTPTSRATRAYYEELLPRLRPNGLIVFDNVLWSGLVADPAASDDQTRALRALDDHVAADRASRPSCSRSPTACCWRASADRGAALTDRRSSRARPAARAAARRSRRARRRRGSTRWPASSIVAISPMQQPEPEPGTGSTAGRCTARVRAPA